MYNKNMSPLIIFPFLLGALAAYLVNYLADVLPVSRRLSHPVCQHCQTPYRWMDYFLFRKCPICNQQRTVRALVVQALLIAASLFLWVFPHHGFPFLLEFSLFVYLTLVFVIDLEHRLILHPVSLFGAIFALAVGIYLHSGNSLTNGIITTLVGGAVGFVIMLVFYFVGEWYVRFMSKKRGLDKNEVALGFGDVNLSGIIGLLLGWPGITAGLLFAVLAGGLTSLFLIIRMVLRKKYNAFTAIPYAPFLILGVVILLYL